MDPLIASAVFIFGLVFGSFLNVCIYRLPHAIETAHEGQSSIWHGLKSLNDPPRSACPKCGHLIRWFDNIPLVSWIVLGAKCRDCKKPISGRYAAVEFLLALLFLACYAKFGLTLAAAKFCILSFLLLGLIFTDAETKLLPDAMTVPGLVIGLLLSLVVPMNGVVTIWGPRLYEIPDTSWMPTLLSVADAVVGAVIGASFIYGASMIYKIARGVEGMGLGDVKLMAMIGAFLGLKLTLFTVFGASIVGAFFGLSAIPSVWIKRTRRRMTRGHEPRAIAARKAWESARKVYRYYAMPFGVFLGTLAFLALFFGDSILQWYWNQFV